MSALLYLMSNIGGPRASKRRILVSVIHSQVLYAVPVWQEVGLVVRIEVHICEKMANVVTIEVVVQERCESYNDKTKLLAAEEVMRKWQLNWTFQPSEKSTTYRLRLSRAMEISKTTYANEESSNGSMAILRWYGRRSTCYFYMQQVGRDSTLLPDPKCSNYHENSSAI
ncbi:hypothetical protein Trydic_g7562 [Trypoxylus dichotomus]